MLKIVITAFISNILLNSCQYNPKLPGAYSLIPVSAPIQAYKVSSLPAGKYNNWIDANILLGAYSPFITQVTGGAALVDFEIPSAKWLDGENFIAAPLMEVDINTSNAPVESVSVNFKNADWY